MIARKAAADRVWRSFLGGGASERGDGRLGSRPSTLRLRRRSASLKLLPPASGLKDAPSMVERARMVKDADELERIRAAVALGAKLFDRALEVIRPGVKEIEVAARDGIRSAPGRGRGNVVSDDHCFGSAVGAASRSSVGAARSPRVGSWSATSVLYFQVIVRTRLALCGWACSARTPARLTRRCGRPSRRRSMPSGRVLPVGEVDAAARKVLRKAGLGTIFYAFDRAWSRARDSRSSAGGGRAAARFCNPEWSSRSSREYTSPANGA